MKKRKKIKKIKRKKKIIRKGRKIKGNFIKKERNKTKQEK